MNFIGDAFRLIGFVSMLVFLLALLREPLNEIHSFIEKEIENYKVIHPLMKESRKRKREEAKRNRGNTK